MRLNWINIHTHKPTNGLNVFDACLGEVETPVASIVYRSMGIHPLKIDQHVLMRLQQIEQAAAEKKIIAVGEAGLDRNAVASLAEQLFCFRRQAEIAAQYHLPLIIHSVRSFSENIALHSQFKHQQNWIVHGFNNRKEILQDLLRHGFFISVGRHVFNPQSHIFRFLPEIPNERLFIETDDSECTIEEVYQSVAERKKMSLEELQQIIKLNFERVFLF